jgi:transmembrane sensor
MLLVSRRLALREAAHWALREDDTVLDACPPGAAADILAVLDDEALKEALGEVAATGRLSDHEVRAMRERQRRTLGVGLASVVVVAGLGAWHVGLPSPAPVVEHIETRRGEQRLVQLADGSRLQLDGDTSLNVTLSSDTRRVELARGEAYFDIAHDARRPFVVQAGTSRTQVLGTAFTIDIGRRAVKLAVYRGKVRFGAADSKREDVVVPAGWRSSFASGSAIPPTRFDPTQQDWRGAWVDTEDMILSELVDALNRRGGRVISPPPGHLANLPLSGRFKLSDPEELLGALGEAYGFQVVRKPGRLDLIADVNAAW